MSKERPPGVLGGLPRTRPHRRSDKRAARPADTEAPASAGPRPSADPKRSRPAAAAKPARPGAAPDPPAGPLGTAVQAAAELAEIGLTASARALRGALARLPRP